MGAGVGNHPGLPGPRSHPPGGVGSRSQRRHDQTTNPCVGAAQL